MFNYQIDNIAHLLNLRSIQNPDRTAYIFLDNGKINSSITYQELNERAKAIAARLQSKVESGSRALLIYSSSEDFLPAFFACLYAKVIAVPTPTVDAVRLKRASPRLKAIALDSQASLILTTSRLVARLEEVSTQITELQSPQIFATDAIDSKTMPSEFTLNVKSSDLAYLQYTSGSTSTPKGVAICHDNLLDNVAQISKSHGFDKNSISATWVPYFHDYGLVYGLIQPLYAIVPCYVLSPITFIKKPVRWLETISRYRVTHSGAPNFAYDYCVSQIKAEQLSQLDLSSWRVAHTGAEPIRQATLEKFADTFQTCGFSKQSFYPSYGLAEATLMVTTKSQNESLTFLTVSTDDLANNKVTEVSSTQNTTNTQTVTACGYAIDNTLVVIVNPQTCIQCSADEVGEIWLSNQSVARGYWNRSGETQQTFQATLPNFPNKSFLRTGDLGFVRDGQLYVTGRLKDLIIVRGNNYYPQDLELIVEQSHPQLRGNASAVFSIDVKGEEQLVVAAEVDSRTNKNLPTDEVIAAIRSAVARHYELPIHAIVLLKRGSIPKTSSGKIQRQACRSQFLGKSLSVVGLSDRLTAQKLEETIIQHPNVNRAVVIDRQVNDRNRYFAYIIPTQKQVPTVEDLRYFLKRQLSDPIVNSITFIPLEAFPKNADGSLNPTALPLPHKIRETLAQNYVAPRNSIEQKLSIIWAKVLWLDNKVGIDDNFFALGGNSLLAASLISQIEEEFEIKFTVDSFPQLSTIKELVPLVEQQIKTKSSPIAEQSLKVNKAIEQNNLQLASEIHQKILNYAIAWQGKRKKPNSLIVGLNTEGSKQSIFWCLQGFRELSQLAKYLGRDRPIYGMRSGHLIMEYTTDNIEALATHYVAEILNIQPDSPYILGGNCQSTWIIFEIARQLIARGKTITLLCLMEQFIPQTYSGKVALFFGRKSKFNPYKYFDSPELGFRKYYRELTLDVFPGEHGQFFEEPNIQVLAEKIASAIEKAQKSTCPQLPQQQYQLLSAEAYRARLRAEKYLKINAGESLTIAVTVENVSTVTWQETTYSGIRLGNHWLNEKNEVICWFDGIANLDRDLLPNSVINLWLKVTAPDRPGFYKLELDLVEEGITWFKDRGSETNIVEIEVRSSANNVSDKSIQINSHSNNKTGIISSLKNLELYLDRGNYYYQNGDMESAILNYNRAIKIAPKQNLTVHKNLGNALSERGNYITAIDIFQQALKIEANNAELWFLLAKTQVKQKHLYKAVNNYKKAIELSPENFWFYLDLGLVLAQLERFGKAIEVYHQAIKLDDTNPQLYQYLGSAQVRAGKIEVGVKNYMKAIELYPDRSHVYLRALGNDYCKHGDFEAAVLVCQQSLIINSQQSGTYISLGKALFGLNKTEEAIASYQKAIELNPKQPFGVYKTLGEALAERGKIEQAIAAYQAAVQLKPNNLNLRHCLEKLIERNKNSSAWFTKVHDSNKTGIHIN